MLNYTEHNSNNSKISFTVIKETEENEKTINRSKEKLSTTIRIKDKIILTQKPSLSGRKLRKYFFSTK